MDMLKIKEAILRKPALFILISLVYVLLVAFAKWGIHPTIGTALFAIGGIVGVYFLDIAEGVVQLTPSPFRSIVFAVLFVIVAMFIVTSSGSMFASGLVLSLYLTMILWQLGEWQIQKHLNDWYRMIAGPVSTRIQAWILGSRYNYFYH